jgi:hypothetical protein
MTGRSLHCGSQVTCWFTFVTAEQGAGTRQASRVAGEPGRGQGKSRVAGKQARGREISRWLEDRQGNKQNGWETGREMSRVARKQAWGREISRVAGKQAGGQGTKQGGRETGRGQGNKQRGFEKGQGAGKQAG